MNRHGELVDSASAPWLILVSCFTFLEVLALFGKLTGTIGIPLFFFGFCGFSLLQWWPCSLLTRCLLGVPMVYVLMNMLFYPSFFLSDIRWFYQIFLDIAFEMVQWRWEDVFSFDDLPHIRSLFFFMFLWLVSMGWTRWFQSPHRRLFLFCCSFLFVALIDFGTEIDVGGAPLRLGFMMLLLSMRLHAARVLAELPQWDQLPANWWWWGWSLLVILGLVAWALPKAPSTWELDLMRYLPQGQLQEDVRGKQTGYRQGDGVLGGSVKQDMRVAFRAQLEMPYYWRGESLEIYTGSRWLHAVGKTSLSFEHLPSSADFRNLFTGVSTKAQQVAITADKPLGRVMFVPGQLVRMQSIDGQPPFTHGGLRVFGKRFLYLSHVESDQDLWSRTTMTVEVPLISEHQLRQVRYDSSKTNPYVQAHLQLPPQLPRRVKQLAERLTHGADNWYDKAVAIEQHLKSNQAYRYSLSEVPPLPEGKDFVDHFLFESKVGYCDHFSTAMVVLLRANQIPARWVKGYAPGELTYSPVTRRYQATVRNKDAHSWVEVYFPGIGWLPFEPTPTFTNPTPNLRLHTEDHEAGGDVRVPASSPRGTIVLEKDPLRELEETSSSDGGSLWAFRSGQTVWLIFVLLVVAGPLVWGCWAKRHLFLWSVCMGCLRMGWLAVGYWMVGWLEQRWSNQTGLTMRQRWEAFMGRDVQTDQEIALFIRWYEQRRYGANEEGKAMVLRWRTLWKIMGGRMQS
jgi:hypothetical protein